MTEAVQKLTTFHGCIDTFSNSLSSTSRSSEDPHTGGCLNNEMNGMNKGITEPVHSDY